MHEKVIRVQYNQGVGETLHENPDRLNQHIRHRQFPRCSKVARGKFTESSTTGTALPLSVRDLGSKKDQADRCDSLQVGAPEPQEFRTQPVPFWLFCFSDTIKGTPTDVLRGLTARWDGCRLHEVASNGLLFHILADTPHADTPTLRPFWSRLCRAVSFVAFCRTCSRTRLRHAPTSDLSPILPLCVLWDSLYKSSLGFFGSKPQNIVINFLELHKA